MGHLRGSSIPVREPAGSPLPPRSPFRMPISSQLNRTQRWPRCCARILQRCAWLSAVRSLSPMIAGATAYIGNPPYVRHHDIARRWKDWYAKRCQSYGIRASRLAGLHLHFFAKVADLARFGDYGCFITAAEWLDVNYGAALRTLLTRNLDVREIHILSP